MNKFSKILIILLCLIVPTFCFVGCIRQADTVKKNIQKQADNFDTYRRMTFVNLYTNERLYYAEGYFSLQTTYSNTYQGQQEIGLIFKVSEHEYKMDYFSIADNVTYVIEQVENTHTDPYHWEIYWYVPIPENHLT